MEELGEIDRFRLKFLQEKHRTLLQAEELASMKKEIETMWVETEWRWPLSTDASTCVALETNRISDAGAEGFKGIVETVEEQHEAHHDGIAAPASSRRRSTVRRRRRRIFDRCTKVEELRHQIRGVVKKSNILTNTHDWKKIQWKTKLETKEMQWGVVRNLPANLVMCLIGSRVTPRGNPRSSHPEVSFVNASDRANNILGRNKA